MRRKREEGEDSTELEGTTTSSKHLHADTSELTLNFGFLAL